MGLFGGGNKFNVDGRTVLLTGGSYGMGKELAKLLSQRGAHLIIVARDPTKLQNALDYAKSHAKSPSTQRFHFISADVTNEVENDRILAEATAWNNGVVPEIVWANAGASTPGLYIETSIETMRQQMDLNYWAAAYLAHKSLKLWLYPATPYTAEDAKRPQAPRHFVCTSSAVAFLGLAGYAPYAPAKTALRSLCDSLRSEVLLYNSARRSKKTTNQVPAPFDINIQCVFPGTIKSPGLQTENQTKHAVTHLLEESDPDQTELEAAQGAIKGLEAGHFMIATSWLVELIRYSGIGGSKRNSIVVDTLGSWLASIVWLFMVPDLDGKVWGWAKKEGMPAFKASQASK